MTGSYTPVAWLSPALGRATERLAAELPAPFGRAGAEPGSPSGRHDDAVAPAMLRRIQRRIGGRDECCRALHGLGARRVYHADADGGANLRIVPGRALILDCDAQALGHHEGAALAHAAQDDRELFATVTCEHVLGPHGALGALRHRAQDRIPGEVPMGVVQPLEMIDVEQEQRERGTAASAGRELALQAVVEGTPIVDTRQAIAHRRRSEEHTSELQSQSNLVCRLLLEKKKKDI